METAKASASKVHTVYNMTKRQERKKEEMHRCPNHGT